MTIAAKLAATGMASLLAAGGFAPTAPQAPTKPTVPTAPTAVAVPASLEITNITGPTRLAVAQEGTWTVHVNTASTSPNLHYSVKWGDENAALRAAATLLPAATTSATFTHAYGVRGTFRPTFTVTDDSGNTVTQAASAVQVGTNVVAHITSITPNVGPTGTLVTLAGSGFASSSVVHFGSTTVAAVSVQGTSAISFVVPSTTPGTYRVWVKGNDRNQGTSNRVTFTVTVPPVAHLSVNGLDAPVALTVGQEGTWTVHASTNLTGALHYSVVWGDENVLLHALSAVLPQTLQTTATFTHAFGAAGTYQPKFTVSDDAGHAATVSASVQVVTP